MGAALLPAGAVPRLVVELTTHVGHFVGRGRNSLVLCEEAATGAAFLRVVGTWDRLGWYQGAYHWAGEAARQAFWGGGRPAERMLHQITAATG